ncbi:MAG TPA: aldehyde dehydrogenase family protein [Vicinamibacterales bacterium]|nr:aldehyde dehydrogenase family protein [Vicinamibacterales bacterium]
MRSLWIDGGWVAPASGQTRRVENPATLELVDEVAEACAADVRRACAVAAAAQPSWGRSPALERGRLLHDAATRMRADRGALSRLLTLEGGKPRIENVDEVEWCAACLDYYAEIARHSHGSSIPPTAEHQINFTIKEPIGVVAAIVPFNYPLLLLVWKLAPALAAGNAVVVKPSELTPLATLRFVELAFAHLPPGIVNVVTGGPEAGAALVDDPDVGCIAFTGSTAVGTQIAVRAAQQLKRVNLELGGIDPLIVFEDADLDVAAAGAAWARFLNNGQVCTSAKRIIVVEPIARAFVDRFVERTRSLRVGDPMDPDTDLGPMISERARTREDQVRRAVAQGARVLEGGRRLDVGPGWFYAPTVLTGVEPAHAVVCEEVFGPIASIQVAADADDAMARAARSDYALGANIYTSNLTWALRAMQTIKAGTFWINDPLTDNDAAPFGGMRKSGMGRELGEEGLDAFRETKHVHLDFVPEQKRFWFPYGRRREEIPE